MKIAQGAGQPHQQAALPRSYQKIAVLDHPLHTLPVLNGATLSQTRTVQKIDKFDSIALCTYIKSKLQIAGRPGFLYFKQEFAVGRERPASSIHTEFQLVARLAKSLHGCEHLITEGTRMFFNFMLAVR